MRLSAAVGAGAVLLLVAAAFPWRGAENIYGSGLLWVFGILLSMLSLYACVVLLLRRRWVKAALHIVVPLITVGALLDATGGERAEFGVFVGPEYEGAELFDEATQRVIPLDFRFVVYDFAVDYYPGSLKEREYRAAMRFVESGKTQNAILKVNHPADVGGWRFYLFSHGTQEGKPFVRLLAKRSPGAPYFNAAFLWLSAVAFLWSFGPRKKKETEAAS